MIGPRQPVCQRWYIARFVATANTSSRSEAQESTPGADTPAPAARRALAPVEHREVVEIPRTHFELFTDHLRETVGLTTRWFAGDLRGSAG